MLGFKSLYQVLNEDPSIPFNNWEPGEFLHFASATRKFPDHPLNLEYHTFMDSKEIVYFSYASDAFISHGYLKKEDFTALVRELAPISYNGNKERICSVTKKYLYSREKFTKQEEG